MGEPDNGYLTPTKFLYYPGEVLEITCHPGFDISTDIKPQCLSDGNWTTVLPSCTNSSDTFALP